MSLKYSKRSRLLGSACASALFLGAHVAYAAPAASNRVEIESAASIGQVQDFSAFESEVIDLDAVSNNDLSIVFDSILDSVTRIGSSETGDQNVSTVTGFGNDASLTITSSLNSDAGLLDASAASSLSSGTVSVPGGASAEAIADMAISLQQNVIDAAATLLNEADFMIGSSGLAPVTDSTLSIYGNTAEVMGALNRAADLIDITVNDTSSTAAIALSQLASASTLSSANNAGFGIDLGMGSMDSPAGGAIDSTVEMAANTARAVAVGNSATNGMTVDGNAIVADAAGEAAARTAQGADSLNGGYTYTALADATYAVSNGQFLVNLSDEEPVWGDSSDVMNQLWVQGADSLSHWDADVQAVLSTDGAPVFDIHAGDDVVNSSISLTGNLAVASARGNEAGNSATIVANSITGDAGTPGDLVDDLENLWIAIGDSSFELSENCIENCYTRTLIDGIYFYSPDADGDYESSGAIMDARTFMDSLAGGTGEHYATYGTYDLMESSDDWERVAQGIYHYIGDDYAVDKGSYEDVEIDPTVLGLSGSPGTEGGTAAVVALANGQGVSDRWIAAHSGAGTVAVSAEFAGDLLDSTLAVDGNAVATQAIGNTAHNAIGATSTDIGGMGDNAAATTSIVWGLDLPASMDADAAFAINSAQSVTDSVVTASLNGWEDDEVDGEQVSTSMLTQIHGDIETSAVSMDGNALTVTAIGNQINGGKGNSIALAGNTIDTTSAIANIQNIGATAVSATAVLGTVEGATPFIEGTEGYWDTPPTEDTSYSYAYTVSGGSRIIYTENLDLDIDDDEIDDYTLEELIAAFTASPYNYVYDEQAGTLTKLAEVGDTGGTGAVTVPGDSGIGWHDTVPDTPAFAGYLIPKGIEIEVGGDVLGSSVTLDGNRIATTATGNSAINATTIDATSLSGVAETARYDDAGQSADHVVSNTQLAAESVVSAVSNGLFGISTVTPTGETYRVQDSTLSVSDNAMAATTTVNAADNSAALKATEVSATAIVSNEQDVYEVYAGASSAMTVIAPITVIDSTVALDGNTNTATLVVNTSSNKLTVDATNLDSFDSEALADLAMDDGMSLAADFLVANNQHALGEFYAIAESNIGNWEELNRNLLREQDGESLWFATAGVTDSTVSASGNSTLSDAAINKAANSLVLNAGSSMTATGGVSNAQYSAGELYSTASSLIGTAVVTDDETVASVDHSAITVNGNVTKASAVANSASNSLSVQSLLQGADNHDAGVTIPTSGDDQVTASYGILNAQWNDAGVDAVVQNWAGIVASNDDGGNTAYMSSLSVMGNAVSAVAIGNSVTNTLSMASLDLGTSSAAIHSNQVNTGDITAIVGNYGFGYSGLGSASAIYGDGLSSSAASITGNTTLASATGNRAVSVLTRSGNAAGVTAGHDD